MRIRTKATILVVLGALSMIVSAQPVSACTAGCTPGFWKQQQHRDFWTGYSPDQTVESVFTVPSDLNRLADDSLLDALRYKGGPGKEGAARILLRAAVATLLNSAYDAAQEWHWHYDFWNESYLTSSVNDALGGSRDEMLSLARELDDMNNLGCPL